MHEGLDELYEIPLALPQRPLSIGHGAFLRPVLHLDAHRPAAASVRMRLDEVRGMMEK